MITNRAFRALLAVGSLLAVTAPASAAGDADPAAALRTRHAELRPRLEKNDFGGPIFLDSREEGNHLKGDVYAVMDHPFERVAASLAHAAGWCEVLILPFNTKHCTSSLDRALNLYVGKKKDTPLSDAYRIDFRYQLSAHTRDFLMVFLDAPVGPLGTKNYRISLEAIPLDAGRTFLHLSYAYHYGAVSNIAMQTYLATAGKSKVGFTVEGRDGDGRVNLVKGMRGVLERNTMRYFLAIDAYLDSLAVPAAKRIEKRINDWFSASERFARQLHEMDRAEYVAMKQREIERLQAAKVAGG